MPLHEDDVDGPGNLPDNEYDAELARMEADGAGACHPVPADLLARIIAQLDEQEQT